MGCRSTRPLSTAPVPLHCKRARHERTKCTAVAAASVWRLVGGRCASPSFRYTLHSSVPLHFSLADRRPKQPEGAGLTVESLSEIKGVSHQSIVNVRKGVVRVPT